MKDSDILNSIWNIRYRALPFNKEQGVLTKDSLLAVLKRIDNAQKKKDGKEKNRDVFPFDHLPYYYCNFGYESFTSLLKKIREIQKREYIATPINKVRGPLGSRALNKIIKTPGKTIREKMGNAKTVEISKSIYTIQSLENQALADCIRKILPMLKERDDLHHLYKELNKLYKSSGINSCSEMKTRVPNNKLLYDPHYRKIWKIFNWIIKLDSIKNEDKENIEKRYRETLYLLILSRLVFEFNLVVADEVVDFSGDHLVTKTSLLFIGEKGVNKTVHFSIDSSLVIHLDKSKLKIKPMNSTLFHIEKIDEIILRCEIERAKPFISVENNRENFVIPYFSTRNNVLIASYYEQGFSLSPRIPFGIKNIGKIEPLTDIDDNSKRDRLLKHTVISRNNFINLITDTIEPDKYYSLSSMLLPMSIAFGLDQLHSEKLKVGDSLKVVNTFSNPVTETEIELRYDSDKKSDYFLRKIPKILEKIDSINQLFESVSKKLDLNIENENTRNAFIEYLIINKIGHLYDSNTSSWETYQLTNEIKEVISHYKSRISEIGNSERILLTHPLISEDFNPNEIFKSGAGIYEERIKNNQLTWREEIISLDMYLPVKEEKLFKKISIVDKDKSGILPIWNKRQMISFKGIEFNLPKGEKEAIIPILFNEESIKYAVVLFNKPLENPLKTKISVSYTYGEKQPYSLSFQSIEDKNESYNAEIIDNPNRVNAKEYSISIPQGKPFHITMEDISNSKGELTSKFFSPNCTVDSYEVEEKLSVYAEKQLDRYIKNSSSNNYKRLYTLGDFLPDYFWDDIERELIKYKDDKGNDIKKRRRFGIAIDSAVRDTFLSRLFTNVNTDEISSDLWSFSYAVWYNEGLIRETFDSRDQVDNINMLIELIGKGLDFIQSELENKRAVSNFSPLLFLALLKLRNSEIQEVKECVSLNNPKVQKLLFKLYDFDYLTKNTRNYILEKDKEILYTDGFTIEIDGKQDRALANMQQHIYLIHKYLTDEHPPAIVVNIGVKI